MQLDPNLLAILMGTGGMPKRRGLDGQLQMPGGQSGAGLDPNLAAILMGTGGLQVRRDLSGNIMLPGGQSGPQFKLPARTQVPAMSQFAQPTSPAPASTPNMSAFLDGPPAEKSYTPMVRNNFMPKPKAVANPLVAVTPPDTRPAFDVNALMPGLDKYADYAKTLRQGMGIKVSGEYGARDPQAEDAAFRQYQQKGIADKQSADTFDAQAEVSRKDQIQRMMQALSSDQTVYEGTTGLASMLQQNQEADAAEASNPLGFLRWLSPTKPPAPRLSTYPVNATQVAGQTGELQSTQAEMQKRLIALRKLLNP